MMLNLIVLDSVGSTNDYIKENCQQLPNRTAVIALEQTEGRGRLGRSWEPVEGCLCLSLLLKEEKIRNDLTLACALAVSDALKSVSIKNQIKWPNDILIDGKKICGILVEGVYLGGDLSHTVIGIGLNLNNETFPESIKDKATSVFLETGHKSDIIKTGKRIATEVFRYSEKAADITEAYSERCVTLGRNVVAHMKNSQIKGRAVSVNADGSLLLETDTGLVKIYSGEVSLSDRIYAKEEGVL